MKRIDFDLLLIYLFLRINNIFKLQKIKVDSFTIYFNDLAALLFEVYYIFKNEIYYFKSKERKPFIIDGGSHIGTSVFYFKKIYPESEIIAFEPDKNITVFLQRNLKANNINDVNVVQSGLFNQDGFINFNPDNSDGGKIEEVGDNIIKVERLSKYINKEVDFLKLNIEGSETSVIRDLNENKKISLIKEMVIEWHSFKGQKQTLSEILNILENNGFKYFIGNFPRAPKGKYFIDNGTQYYLLLYAKRIN